MDRKHPAARSQHFGRALDELLGFRKMEDIEKQHRVTGFFRQSETSRDHVSGVDDYVPRAPAVARAVVRASISGSRSNVVTVPRTRWATGTVKVPYPQPSSAASPTDESTLRRSRINGTSSKDSQGFLGHSAFGHFHRWQGRLRSSGSIGFMI